MLFMELNLFYHVRYGGGTSCDFITLKWPTQRNLLVHVEFSHNSNKSFSNKIWTSHVFDLFLVSLN